MPTPGPLELVIILVIALSSSAPASCPTSVRARQEHPRVPQGVVGRPGGRQRSRSTRRRCPADARRPGRAAARPGRPGGRRPPPRPPRPSPQPRPPRPPRRRPRRSRRRRPTRRPSPASRSPLEPTMADADALLEPGVTGRPEQHPTRSRPPPAAAPGDETVMSLVDHLGELRNRLFRSILAVARRRRPSASTSRPTSASFLHRAARRPAAPGPRRRRRVRHPGQDRARRRDHPGDAGPALPGLGVHRARA